MKRIRKLTAFLLVLILGCSVVAPAYTAQAATVKLNATKKSLYGVGTTCQLKLQNATEVSWSTSNKKIATVSSTGKVTAKGVGSCTITAKNKKTGKKYRCSVKVYEVKLNTTGIQFESIGETYQLTLKNATKVRWSSSDENVATVSTKGKVSATGEGSCTIYAENINTGKKYSCKVSVESLKSTIVSINLVKSQTQKLLYVCCDTKLKGIPYLS